MKFTTKKIPLHHMPGQYAYPVLAAEVRKRFAGTHFFTLLRRGLPTTTLPVDCTGNGTVSCPAYLNDTANDCQLAAACHIDNILTYRQGQAVQSQFDDAALAAWFAQEYDVLAQWQSSAGLPGAEAALAAYQPAVMWDYAQVNLLDPTTVQFVIDQFYAMEAWLNLPDSFYNGYTPGSTWPNNIGGNPTLAHAMAISDLAVNGFVRGFTWGSWAWLGQAFIQGAGNIGIAVFSPRQFDPKTGLDSKGRHITSQAALWTLCTGHVISPSLLSQFPPPPTGDPVFVDSGLSPNTTYQYRVRAKNSAGVGPWSAPISVTTPAIPPPPPVPVFLDNGGSGYSTTGTWGTAGGMTLPNQPYGYGGSLQYNNVAGSTATWKATGLASGSYQVLATWQNDPSSNNRATSVTYTIFDGSTQVGTVTLNQNTAPKADITAGGPAPLPVVAFQKPRDIQYHQRNRDGGTD